MTDTLEACQRKIAELVQSTQTGAPDQVPDIAAVSKDIAKLYVRMADIFLANRDLENAAKCLETALQLDPQPWTEQENMQRTKLFLTEMLARHPDNIEVMGQLGEVHHKLGEGEKALEYFRQVLKTAPDDTRSLYMMPLVQQTMGDLKGAEESFRHIAKVQPLYKIAATQTPPEFSVLVIFAPLLGNTPVTDLMGQSTYAINIYSLLANEAYDVSLLKNSGQVVINAISEADSSSAILSQAAQLMDKLGLPVINHPSRIQLTSRDYIALLLQDIPNCRVAQIIRHAAGETADVGALEKKISFAAPFLVRPAGTHGGERFEKAESLEELSLVIQQETDTDHYIMDYIDYQSPDGHFRKYRFFFIDDEILPYHLAIGNHWKVHHATTDMNKTEWMQTEEKAFLENPADVFSPKHYEALRAVREAIGLEYFGIDCGIDRAGNLVVFEANATMLVHWHNETFPYKTPFVAKIKQAFDAMLKRRIGLGD
jgi:tetratricopeptide (TPR) repeat protein